MLAPAIRHKEELEARFHETWSDPKYKFWTCASYHENHEVAGTTWNGHQFVSLDSSGKVIGYIGYRIDRGNDLVYALNIVNFSDNKVAFGIDAGGAMRDIFDKLA